MYAARDTAREVTRAEVLARVGDRPEPRVEGDEWGLTGWEALATPEDMTRMQERYEKLLTTLVFPKEPVAS